MVFEELLNGHELILRHTNSVKELPSKGFKDYCPNNSWLEQKQIENQLEEKLNFIKAERIEKSNCLSQAEWIHELKKAKVTKKVGKLWETLGHHHDNEDWLLPEEALFLLENCELQLFCDSICISIEDCYRLIFQESDCSLDEYRVFSYLSRAGFRVVRHSPSVTATRYERQVKLDTVIQMQRRSPPRTSAEESVTVIDDDISIVEKSEHEEKNNANQTSKGSEKRDQGQVEVIEIDDEPVEKDVVHEIDSDSGSDSDIVCISSPSHVPDKNVRNWYPTLQKCLRRPMEALIDLCDDENSPVDDKQLIESNLDLLRVPKRVVLSLVPSAKNGVSFIQVPDSRLLPPNIVPRYSEYKVSLNIRSDTTNQNYMYRDQQLFNGGMQFDMSNNPLLQKAEEMQLAAMSMIQTAAALMSVANSANQRPPEPWNMCGNNIRAIANQNPNELWNMYSNRGTETVPFNQFPLMAQTRPRFWNPRRGRFPRRRFFGDRQTHRSPRKPHRFDNTRYQTSDNESSDIIGVRMSGSNSPSMVVILSDDESEAKNCSNDESKPEIVKKRKQSCEMDLNKRLKTETDTDIASESSSCILDVVRKEPDIVLKKESGEDLVKIESELKSKCSSKIKTESDDKKLVPEDVKTEVVGKQLNGVFQPTVKNECESNSVGNKNIITKTERSKLQSDNLTYNAVVDNLLERKPKDLDKNSPSLNTQGEISSTSNMSVDTSQENLNESPSNDKIQQAPVHHSEISSSSIDNVSTQEIVIDTNKSNEEITSWEQYKNKPDDFDEVDTLIKFDQCSTYGHVLSALQIFKQIEVNRVNKKFKVSFDVYLPDSNFKKTLKVLPNYRVIVLKSNEELPSTNEIESLKIEYQDSIPFLFSVVFDETIAFYLYNSVSINKFCD